MIIYLLGFATVILVVLMMVGVIIAPIAIGLILLGLVAALIEVIYNSNKNKKFYKECKKQGLGNPETVNREKLKLIGELYNVSDEYKVYEKRYIADHAKEYPEYIAAKKKKRNKILLIVLFSLLMLCLGFLTEWFVYEYNYRGYYSFRSFIRFYSDLEKLALALLIAAAEAFVLFMFYGFYLGCSLKIEELKKKKEERRKEEEKLRDRINKMK